MKKLRFSNKTVLILSCIAAALVILLIVMILLIPKNPELPDTTEPSTSETTEATEPPTSETTEEPTTEPVPTEPQMLKNLAELYQQNPDLAGWIKIEGTKLDYPVMYTPDDPEKYLHLNFEERYDFGGLPFLEDACLLDPESDNMIIYGHNMNNGTMFRTLMLYTDQKYWEEHPQVTYSTLYEERTYDILAVFYDRVYYKYEDVFKFYKFIEAEDEEHFNEAIAYYKEHALYDTGITAEYGDRLITLVTCSYHHQNGRFVLVARQVVEEPAEENTP